MIIDGFWGNIVGLLLCILLGCVTGFIYFLMEEKTRERRKKKGEEKDE